MATVAWNLIAVDLVPVPNRPFHPFRDRFCKPIFDGGLPQMSFLNNLLLAQWENRMGRGLFRYDVTSCETKVITGKYSFIAQLNEGRHLKKRQNFILTRSSSPLMRANLIYLKWGKRKYSLGLSQAPETNLTTVPVPQHLQGKVHP